MKKFTKTQSETAVSMYASGATYREIGDSISATMTGVYWHIERLIEEGRAQRRPPKRVPQKPWNDEEIAFLRETHGKMRLADIAKCLGRTRSSAYYAVVKFCGDLQKKQAPEWSPAEDYLLAAFYSDRGVKCICELTGRPWRAVKRRAGRLKIRLSELGRQESYLAVGTSDAARRHAQAMGKAWAGVLKSASHRANISAAHKGRSHSSSHHAKVAATQMRNRRWRIKNELTEFLAQATGEVK
jgi:hypothetical protein